MTKQEYAEYQAAVDAFFKREGIGNLSADEDSQEPHFSSRPCQCCRRYFGGDRFYCSGYNRSSNQAQYGYEICTDCVYYAEYGRLDDMTMLEIEKS